MDSIPGPELNQHTGAVQARVAEDKRADLIRRGRLIPASDRTPLALPAGPADLSTDSTEVVSSLREERL
jgi:hypothetical protein